MYGSDIWVATGEMLKVLEGFHHRKARSITGMKATLGEGREWEYPLVGAAMEAVGLHHIREYIKMWQETIFGKGGLSPNL